MEPHRQDDKSVYDLNLVKGSYGISTQAPYGERAQPINSKTVNAVYHWKLTKLFLLINGSSSIHVGPVERLLTQVVYDQFPM